jgi:hypothetical protein
VDAKSLKNMVGPCGLEPQTSTVSKSRGYLRRAVVSVMQTAESRTNSDVT